MPSNSNMNLFAQDVTAMDLNELSEYTVYYLVFLVKKPTACEQNTGT